MFLVILQINNSRYGDLAMKLRNNKSISYFCEVSVLGFQKSPLQKDKCSEGGTSLFFKILSKLKKKKIQQKHGYTFIHLWFIAKLD